MSNNGNLVGRTTSKTCGPTRPNVSISKCVGKLWAWQSMTCMVYAFSPDDIAQVDLHVWSKLWRPGVADLCSMKHNKNTAWSVGTLHSIVKHCLEGKARGADGWGMSEIKLLP
eukprot:438325-Amphidinium_carterae.1